MPGKVWLVSHVSRVTRDKLTLKIIRRLTELQVSLGVLDFITGIVTTVPWSGQATGGCKCHS